MTKFLQYLFRSVPFGCTLCAMRGSHFQFTSMRLASFFFLVLHVCMADLRHGYSMLQYGYKLDRRMITSYDKYSILDCVEDCLRTTRCRSVNYHQGAHFCQTNFENRTTLPDLYKEKPGWIYSAKEDWDKGIAGACSESNCALNEKCISKPFGHSSCVLSDCGIPLGEGFSRNEVQEWDAIGISRRIHITCSLGYKKEGSERFVCLSDGTWKTDLICSLEGCFKGSSDRVLEKGPIRLDINGKTYCTEKCKSLGEFRYIGLQNGNECFCGKQVRFSPKRLYDSECDEPCRDNNKETCGAVGKIEIYSI